MISKTTVKSELSIAVSIGEPAGIGPDVIIESWLKRQQLRLPHFTVIGSAQILAERADTLGVKLKLSEVRNGNEALNSDSDTLPVLETTNKMQCEPGKPQPSNAQGVIEAINIGVEKVMGGEFCALTTSPINKKALYDAQFEFPGHTEYLAHLASKQTGEEVFPVMMLAGPQLRSVPVTIHIALEAVKMTLTQDLILRTARIAAKDLRDSFGIENPILAIAGVNPHAGEEGSMGYEEIQFIAPAVEKLRSEGIDAIGPLPADTMFHERARKTYDVAICMYHDQALIPAKTLGFDDAVNATLGLPFVRTSPDHGTAYDLAGSGNARPDSFIAALKMASQMAKHQEKKH